MNWLLIGKNGMLGSVFANGETGLGKLSACVDIDELDITKPSQIDSLFSQMRPQAVLNCSAYTNVDGAQTETDLCRAVNVDGVKNLALACEKWGAILIHYSTDFVFDGTKQSPYTETDVPCPINAYGQSKLDGEQAIKAILPDNQYLIIRTSWLFGPRGKNFVATILNLAKDKPKLSIVDDQYGSPTYTLDLAGATVLLLNKSARGIYNISNAGSCTWYGFAKYALDCAGLADYPTEKITAKDLNRPAKRPRNSVLSTEKFEHLCHYRMPTWQDAVKRYVDEFPV